MAEEVQETLPTATIDLQRRQAAERGEEAEMVGEPRSWQVEGNETDAYIGTDPEYQNYADETHKPYASGEDHPEAVVEQRVAEFAAADKTNVTSENSEQGQEQPVTAEPAPEPRRRREPAPE